MPTFRHGRNTVFRIQDAANTVQNVSDALREVNFPSTVDTVETTAFTAVALPNKTYVVGFRDSSFSVSGMFDATYDGYFQGIYGLESARTFFYAPEGLGASKTSYAGSCYLTNYEITGGVGDMVAISATFQVTGTVTRTFGTIT